MVASKTNCYPKSWRPKQPLNQKWNKLWDKLICVTIGGGWDPNGPPNYADATSTSWVCCRINTSWLANVMSTTLAINTSLTMPWTLQQTTQYYTQYYTYCIWNLKLRIQIKLNMALLEIYWPWIICESWYCLIYKFLGDFLKNIDLHHPLWCSFYMVSNCDTWCNKKLPHVILIDLKNIYFKIAK